MMAVVYGTGQPAALSFQPLGGYSEEQVATALVLVCHSSPDIFSTSV